MTTPPWTERSRQLGLALLLPLAAACGSGGAPTSTPSASAPAPAAAPSPDPAPPSAMAGPDAAAVAPEGAVEARFSGSVHVVHPGESIQAAVDAARPGDTVVVRPGTYREAGSPCPTDAAATCAVVVTTERVRLVGRGAVLENPGGQDKGIAVARRGARGDQCLTDPAQRIAGNEVEGFTVRGFDGDGIFLLCADDWRVAGNAARGNREYGIFPSHSGKGRLTGNLATGANDTGLYIGQSHDVRVDHNFARDNVSGYEIENCSGVVLDHNVATGNTAGILTFTLPFLDVGVNDGNRIEGNVVVANNRDNTCLDPADTVCLVPPGTGILDLAADRNEIRRNLVTGHDTAGIAVFDFCAGTQTPADLCAQLDIDPLPDGNRITGNVVLRNGGTPRTDLVPGADLVWSGAGTGNCWSDNLARTTASPVALPACGGN